MNMISLMGYQNSGKKPAEYAVQRKSVAQEEVMVNGTTKESEGRIEWLIHNLRSTIDLFYELDQLWVSTESLVYSDHISTNEVIWLWTTRTQVR